MKAAASARKVIIIGAGPGGLASAMVLAKAGLDVTVLERHSRVGGRTSILEGGPYKFDLGPTFFLYPRVIEEIFASCGRNMRREIEMVRLDPQYHLVFGAGGELKATPDLARMRQAIARLSPGDAPQFDRFMSENREKLRNFRKVLETPFLGWRDLLRPSFLPMLPLLRPHRSVMSDLESYFKDPRVQLAFTFQAKYLGMSPFQCPSLFSILSFLEYEHGVWHPMGGCGAVSQVMAKTAADLGAKFRLNEPVEKILFDGRKAAGVKTASGELKADAVIVNADFARAMKNLVPDNLRRRWSDKKIAKKKFSCSTFMLYLGLDGACDQLSHHTIYFAKDYKKNLDDIINRHVLSDDPSFYVQNPGATDPSLAPKGQTALYVLLPITHQTPNVDWKTETARFRALALKQLEKIGLKDIEKRIRFEKIITPDGWSGDMEIHLGATFNLAHNWGQMLHMRPRNRFEDVDGMYIVGGGTHPGSGLPVIYEGARISSRLLLQDFGLSTEFLDAPMRAAHNAEAIDNPVPSLDGAL